jgi:uncharacterized membrane protein
MDETTVFFAKVASAYFLVSGLGFLLSTGFYERMTHASAPASPMTLNLSGAVHFLVGVSMLIRHLRFGSAPEIVVTLVGVAALTKGAMLIVLPEQTLKAPRSGATRLKLSGVSFVVVGTYLGYVGYFW